MNWTRWSLALAVGLTLAGMAQAKGKTPEALPDSAFAAIERGAHGEKLRHLPYRNASGQDDPKLLRSALRMWKRVKWANAADAQPALAQLKSAQSQLCREGKMTCGKGRKTARKSTRPGGTKAPKAKQKA